MRLRLWGVLALAATSGVANAAGEPEAVKRSIEAAFPVQVLRMEPTEIDGRAAFFVRVMARPGAVDGAFGVTTLIVDAQTSALIPAFRHRSSGYTLPEALAGEPRSTEVPKAGVPWR